MSSTPANRSFFNLPTLLTTVGLLLFGLFLAGYFLQTRPGMEDLGANLSFIGLNYFLFPLVGGIALRLSQMQPAPLLAPLPTEIERYRTEQATTIQKEVLADISKYSYFKSAHMADALKRLGLGRRDGELPLLTGYRELVEEGRYVLALRFDSTKVDRERWLARQPKFNAFFGKGVATRLEFPGNDVVDLFLRSE